MNFEGDDTTNPVQSSPSPDNVGLRSTSTSGDENTRFVTNVLYQSNGNVYGAEVLLFDVNDVNIEKILITNQTDFNSWTELIDNITNAYVPYTEGDAENLIAIKEARAVYEEDKDWESFESTINGLSWSDLKEMGSLEKILKNELTENKYPVEINATKFMGMESDSFSKVGHTHNFAKDYHASKTTVNGVGTNTLYGHCKIINNLNTNTNVSGEALSAYQGRILSDRIEEVDNKNKWTTVTGFNPYLKYAVNEDLQLIVCNYNRGNYQGVNDKTGMHLLHQELIPEKYRPVSRVTASLYRGDVVLYYETDGSIKLYNLTKLSSIDIHAQVMWYYEL